MYIIDLVIFKSRVCLAHKGILSVLTCPRSSRKHLLGTCPSLCLCRSAGEHLQSESCSFWLSLRGSKSSCKLHTCSQEMDSIALPGRKHALNEREGSTCVLGWVLKPALGYSGDTLCLLTLPAYARSPFSMIRHYLLNKNCRDPKACTSPKEQSITDMRIGNKNKRVLTSGLAGFCLNITETEITEVKTWNIYNTLMAVFLHRSQVRWWDCILKGVANLTDFKNIDSCANGDKDILCNPTQVSRKACIVPHACVPCKRGTLWVLDSQSHPGWKEALEAAWPSLLPKAGPLKHGAVGRNEDLTDL